MMLRYIWLFIISMAILSACSAPLPATPAPAATPTASLQASPTAAPTSIETQPAPVETLPVPVTGVQPTPALLEAVVAEDGLNLRVGPGLNHRIMGVLQTGQKVTLEGRSVDGKWIAVRMPDGKEGWVFGVYLKTTTNLGALPVLEAYGGPVSENPQPTPSKRYRLDVLISDNQATVTAANFPANSDLVFRLGVRGDSQSLIVASGRTDEKGALSLVFDMPLKWADGSPLTQSELRLTAGAADGSYERGVNVVYYSGQ